MAGVQRLVKLHGGSVEACSDGLGHGSEFIVRLPTIPAPVAGPPPLVPIPASAGPEILRRMLIVDDNEDSAHSMAMLQSRRNYEGRTAFTRSDAVAAAAEVVLLDIGLPGMDVRDLVEDFATRVPQELKIDAIQIAEGPAPLQPRRLRVYCLPARADRDELAGAMLTQLLALHDFDTLNASSKLVAADLIELVEKASVEIVCISVVAPSTVIHARYLCTKLRRRCRKLKIVIGLWGATDNITDATRRLRDSGTDEVVISLAQAVEKIAKHASSLNAKITTAQGACNELTQDHKQSPIS